MRPAASTAEAKRQRVRTGEVKVVMVEVDNLQERGVGILKQVRKP